MEEIRIAAIGNVDSAKSTTISVIANNVLDDGKGKARSLIMKHPHEKDTGRTSSVTQHYIKTDDKIIGFVDLAGHEKYLKTTVSGLNGYFIDYAMVTIGVDRGIIGMTKEHMAIAVALKIPMFIVITKIDIAVENKLQNIQKRLRHIFKHPLIGNKQIEIINDSNIDSLITNYSPEYDNIPVFLVSNTTGENISNLRNFISSLRPNPINDFGTSYDEESTFIIDERFRINGIGIVVSGIVKEGELSKDSICYIGPFGGKFKKVAIKSIHDNFEQFTDKLSSGQGGCFNIKLIDKKESLKFTDIKKGHILTTNPHSFRKFVAEVQILHHPTTIKVNYQPTIHCGTVRQCAKIYHMDKPLIRTGDKALVSFEFMYKPEYINIGQEIVFREGRTKGVGTICEILK
jgi:GTPase